MRPATGRSVKRRVMAVALVVLAAITQEAVAQGTTVIKLVPVDEKITEVACLLYKAFVDVAGALASLVFLIAAVKWVTSRDDAKVRVRQRETMTHAVIGLLLLLMLETAVVAITGITSLPAECTI